MVMIKNLDNEKLSALASVMCKTSIDDVIRKFEEYNECGADFCDSAIDLYLDDFIELLADKRAKKEDYKKISELCLERSKQVYKRIAKSGDEDNQEKFERFIKNAKIYQQSANMRRDVNFYYGIAQSMYNAHKKFEELLE